MTQALHNTNTIVLSDDYIRIKSWLTILMNTYSAYPTRSLAKVILYYVTKLAKHEDAVLESTSPCDYYSLLKYWQWLAS